jgi:PAS domain S-box-containing protein
MVTNWLTFGFTPLQETRFRQAVFKSDIALTRIVLLIILPVLAAFAFIDYIIFGLTRPFYILLTLRFALLFYTVFFLSRLGQLADYRDYDRTEFLWALFFAAYVLITAASRPHAFIAHVIVAVLAVFITVLVVPNRFINQIIISFIYTAGETIIIMPHTEMPMQVYIPVFLTMCGANLIAVLCGRQFHLLRRKEFLALEDAENARTEAGEQINVLRQAEQALQQSQVDLARAQEVGQIGSWRLDVRSNVLTWSDENHRIFGVPKGTPLTYETFLQTVHPEDRDYVDTSWKTGLRGESYDIEHRLVVDGEIKWVREKAYLELDENGQLIGGFGITQDITKRKLIEMQLKKHSEELQILNRDLTRFNRLAIGRELRMMELKSEINELCGELGRPPVYGMEGEKLSG